MSPVIRIHEDVAAELEKRRRPGESINDVARRVVGLEPIRKWRDLSDAERREIRRGIGFGL